MERTFGWRHFRVTQKRKEGKDTYILLVATCDEATQFWVSSAGCLTCPRPHVIPPELRMFSMPTLGIKPSHSGSFVGLWRLDATDLGDAAAYQVNIRNLKDRQRFAAGWLRKEELSGLTSAGAQCRVCSGSGEEPCPLCMKLAGKLVEM